MEGPSSNLRPNYPLELGLVTHTCVCGNEAWVLDWVMFDDYEIAAHSLDMTCSWCLNRAKTPTLADKPDDERH